MSETPKHKPMLDFVGDSFGRGQSQALQAFGQVQSVRSAVTERLQMHAPVLARSDSTHYLQLQRDFLMAHDPEGLQEVQGIAAGFALELDDILAYLHLNILNDMHEPVQPAVEGCTSWARTDQRAAAWLVKNRDYRGEHGALQQVMRHSDPSCGDRQWLCVGSLGSPGAFSSGINSDGFAVSDTQIATRDHGVGWLRYFLMTALLRDCANVQQALEFVRRVPHSGGGTLILADANGQIAAVELGHQHQLTEPAHSGWSARTNHYLAPELEANRLAPARDALNDSSPERLQVVTRVLQGLSDDINERFIQRLMAGHAVTGSLCRHPVDGGSRTLSTAIYNTTMKTLLLSHGNPCAGHWQRYQLNAVPH
jgi:predicted choloylglycine hydrolase